MNYTEEQVKAAEQGETKRCKNCINYDNFCFGKSDGPCEGWEPCATAQPSEPEQGEASRRVRCNHCMSEFDEEYIEVDARGPDSGETCPCCGNGDALMDIEMLPQPEQGEAKIHPCIHGAQITCEVCLGSCTHRQAGAPYQLATSELDDIDAALRTQLAERDAEIERLREVLNRLVISRDVLFRCVCESDNEEDLQSLIDSTDDLWNQARAALAMREEGKA